MGMILIFLTITKHTSIAISILSRLDFHTSIQQRPRIDLKMGTSTSQQLRSTVQKLLTDRRDRQRAQDFQLEIDRSERPSIDRDLCF
jgi:hypothetical protein